MARPVFIFKPLAPRHSGRPLGPLRRVRAWKLITFVAMLAAVAALVAYATPRAKRRVEAMSCGNYMCSICIGARSWAMDNNNYMPADFLSMSNELSAPRILVCPGDHSRRPAADWASFTSDQSSYQIVAPHVREGDTNGVFLRCKFHHDHIGYADGTVFDGTRRRTKVP
jgi:hypothetical protein